MVKRGKPVRFVYRDSVWHGCDLGMGVGRGVVLARRWRALPERDGWEPYLTRVESNETCRWPGRFADLARPSADARADPAAQARASRPGLLPREVRQVDILGRFRAAFERLERDMLIPGPDSVDADASGAAARRHAAARVLRLESTGAPATPRRFRMTARSIPTARRTVAAWPDLAAGGTAGGADADWPQFRGPASRRRLPETRPGEGVARRPVPKVLWRSELGGATPGSPWPGPSLHDVLDGPTSSRSLDAGDGPRRSGACGPTRSSRTCSATGRARRPTVDGGVVYVLSAKGNGCTRCRPRTGKAHLEARPAWRTSARRRRSGVSRPRPWSRDRCCWSTSGASRGSSIVAFDKKTGEEVWRSQDDKAPATPRRSR